MRRRAEEELRYVSYHDPLTGLHNRAYFEEEMRRLEGSRFYPITIVSTDLNGLKVINDSMGHERGDEFIADYAHVLKASFRTSDVVARLGGDEFAVFCRTLTKRRPPTSSAGCRIGSPRTTTQRRLSPSATRWAPRRSWRLARPWSSSTSWPIARCTSTRPSRPPTPDRSSFER